jgi:hypothetical protein
MLTSKLTRQRSGVRVPTCQNIHLVATKAEDKGKC